MHGRGIVKGALTSLRSGRRLTRVVQFTVRKITEGGGVGGMVMAFYVVI